MHNCLSGTLQTPASAMSVAAHLVGPCNRTLRVRPRKEAGAPTEGNGKVLLASVENASDRSQGELVSTHSTHTHTHRTTPSTQKPQKNEAVGSVALKPNLFPHRTNHQALKS